MNKELFPIRQLNVSDAQAASELHSSWAPVGLHSVFGTEFLSLFYTWTIESESLYSVGAFDQSRKMVGLGFLVIKPNYLGTFFRSNWLKIAFLTLKRLPFLIRMPQRFVSLINETLRPSGGTRSSQSIELGFIVVARSSNAGHVSKSIFETLKAAATKRSFKKMTSVVSSGHHASLIMHSAFGFKKTEKRHHRVHFEIDL